MSEGALLTTRYFQPTDVLFPWLRGTPAYHRDDSDRYVFWRLKDVPDYWNHPVLSKALLEAMEILLQTDKTMTQIAGRGYEELVQASMTAFLLITGDARFQAVLDKFFAGQLEPTTEKILREKSG